MAKTQDKIDIQAATLIGNIRDEIMALFKNHADWKSMPEGKQRDVAFAVEQISKSLTRQAVKIVAARGFRSISGTLQQVTVKDGLKIVLTASKFTDHRSELIDSQGNSVLLVLADTSPFSGARTEPEIDPDQPDMLEPEDAADDETVNSETGEVS